MAPHSGIRPVVREVREELERQRAHLKIQHAARVPAVQLCAQWTQACDQSLRRLLEDVLSDSRLPRDFALVAHGGYGRRDTAPYSDLDLMLLHGRRRGTEFAELAKRLSRHIYDAGFQLGFSVRSAAECISQSQKDVRILTSLLESRLLYGEHELFEQYCRAFQRFARRRSGQWIQAIIEARREERRRYGDTVYLLEPNIKRSRGALRDWQLVRWLGGVRSGVTDPEHLMRQGILTTDDYRELTRAREFLLWLRNDLHFHANRAQDVLSRSEQLRIAAQQAYPETEAERPVEAFMREYFRHTRSVRDASQHFCDTVRPRSRIAAALEPVVSHRVARDYLVGPVHIRARTKTRRRLTQDVGEVLRLMDLANWYARRIDHETWQVIRKAMRERGDWEITPAATQRFLSFLSHPARLGNLLRRLHELRILELFVPPMRHAHCLVQFNEYHKYTVDEHCILAVQRVTEFFDRDDELGRAYRELQPKHLLHLALLLHDLGKGFPGDHSRIGGELAQQTGERLGLPSREVAMIRALVENHLLMSHLAQQQNIYDESTWLKLAQSVGSPFMLQMLYILTCADLAAVGPGVLTDWKLRLLTQLYQQTRAHLTQDLGERPASRLAEQKKKRVLSRLEEQGTSPEQQTLLDLLPRELLLSGPVEQIIETVKQLEQADSSRVTSWSRYEPKPGTIAYTVVASASRVPGAFHRLTGALTSHGLQILSADIFTLGHRWVLDRFVVSDPDYDAEPPKDRQEQICQALAASLNPDEEAKPRFRQVWQSRDDRQRLEELPVRVRFDNATSRKCTIVSVFAYDRTGLLYDIARTLFELGLDVQSAKIGTHLDQVTDVFYVVNDLGEKVRDEAELERIRAAILQAVSGDEPAP